MTVDELAQEIRRIDGAHTLGAGSLAEALMPFLTATPPRDAAPTTDPYREHLAQQAENIDQERLARTLTLMGSACAGSGQEGFSARLAENVNRLILAVDLHFRDAAPRLSDERCKAIAKQMVKDHQTPELSVAEVRAIAAILDAPESAPMPGPSGPVVWPTKMPGDKYIPAELKLPGRAR